MTVRLKKSQQQMSLDLSVFISSPGLAGGTTHSLSLDGTAKPGQEVARVNRSASPGSRMVPMINGHLWPEFFRLIGKQRPPAVFGEQVAGALGIEWADGVAKDMEAIGYAFGAAVLPSTCVGAGHQRNRLFFVANPSGANAAGGNPYLWRSPRAQQVARPWAFANWQGGRPDISLVNGLPDGMDKRIAGGFGNAIVPQVAAEFISAYMERSA